MKSRSRKEAGLPVTPA